MKDKTITVRVTSEEYAKLLDEAESKNSSLSTLIRDKVCEPDPTDTIKKKDLTPRILKMKIALDRAELKDKRTTRQIQRTLQELWNLL